MEDTTTFTPNEMSLLKLMGNPDKMAKNLQKDDASGYKRRGAGLTTTGGGLTKTGGFPIAAVAPFLVPLIGPAIRGLINLFHRKTQKRGAGLKLRTELPPELLEEMDAADRKLVGLTGGAFWDKIRGAVAKFGPKALSAAFRIPARTADIAARPLIQRMIPRGLGKAQHGGRAMPINSHGDEFVERARPFIHFIIHKLGVPPGVHKMADGLLDERAARYRGAGFKDKAKSFWKKLKNVSKKVFNALLPHMKKAIPALANMAESASSSLIDKVANIMPERGKEIFSDIAHGVQKEAIEKGKNAAEGFKGLGVNPRYAKLFEANPIDPRYVKLNSGTEFPGKKKSKASSKAGGKIAKIVLV